MWAREAGKRLAVLVLTVVVVVAVAGAGPALLAPSEEEPSLQNPEYDPGTVVPEPLNATGTIDPEPGPAAGTNGTVLVDRAHANRFGRSDIEPLVDALVRHGYRVEFYTGGDLGSRLADADTFLVIDPGSEYLPGDVDDVRQFTGNGGHLVMIGEPDRTTISANFLGASVQTQESRLTTLASSYGMSVDTQYLYNQEHADGTFKHVLARPTGQGDLDDVDQAAMYTAAAVTARGGTVLLRSAPNTMKSGTDEVTGEYPVAVRKGNTVLLGDKTFLRGDRFNVADNERFIAYLVEFMLHGDHEPPAGETADGTTTDGETPTTAGETADGTTTDGETPTTAGETADGTTADGETPTTAGETADGTTADGETTTTAAAA